MKLNLKQLTKTLRILCAIALLSVGFAHTPVMAYAAPASGSAAYQLPDGTLPDLCIVDASGNQKGNMTDHGCDACLLSASILVPNAPANAGDTLRVSSEISVFERSEAVFHRLYPPNSGPRAPPSFLMNI